MKIRSRIKPGGSPVVLATQNARPLRESDVPAPPNRTTSLVLLATGLLLFALAPDLSTRWLPYLIMIFAAAAAAVPAINQRLTSWLDRLRNPSAKVMAITFA